MNADRESWKICVCGDYPRFSKKAKKLYWVFHFYTPIVLRRVHTSSTPIIEQKWSRNDHNDLAWEPDDSARPCLFYLLWHIRLASRSDSYPADLAQVGPVTTVFQNPRHRITRLTLDWACKSNYSAFVITYFDMHQALSLSAFRSQSHSTFI